MHEMVKKEDCPWVVKEVAHALHFQDGPREQQWFLDEIKSALFATHPDSAKAAQNQTPESARN